MNLSTNNRPSRSACRKIPLTGFNAITSLPCSLPDSFRQIADPRCAQGLRHRVHVVLAIAAGAVFCRMRDYKAISDWAQELAPKARARFGCRCRNGKYNVPSESTIRNALIRVKPSKLDQTLQQWNVQYGTIDESLAIDGETMCNAIDDTGKQTHIMSAVGRQSKQCYTQKKSGLCPSKEVTKKSRPTKSKLLSPSSTTSTSKEKQSLPTSC